MTSTNRGTSAVSSRPASRTTTTLRVDQERRASGRRPRRPRLQLLARTAADLLDDERMIPVADHLLEQFRGPPAATSVASSPLTRYHRACDLAALIPPH